jgi:hypothetical protein
MKIQSKNPKNQEKQEKSQEKTEKQTENSRQKKKKLWHYWQMAVVTNSLAQFTQFTWDQLLVPL